jgi:hypothetical protein
LKKFIFFKWLVKVPRRAVDPSSHRKFAIRPTLVRCTIVEQATTSRNGDSAGQHL